jgi:predicted acylesterase/phospholipase RssA
VPRYCDLVMKGGITSGVVYPLAVTELAGHYRLRNVGGTSAGAIAAAAAAAAEHGHRRGADSFAELAELPGWLEGNLASLFQPSAGAEPLFGIAIASTRGKNKYEKAWEIFKATVRGFPFPILIGALLFASLSAPTLSRGGVGNLLLGALAAVLLGGLGALAATGWRAWRRLRRVMSDNYLGLCTGYGTEEDDPQPLTSWLADTLDRLAGKDDASRPLVFADLWGTDDPEADRDVNLEMITTCLTQRRPMRLPFEEKEWRNLWFRSSELRRLFPPRIVEWMEARSPGTDEEDEDLKRMPRPADMPVIVAARMSLSFPFLISAIPLWAVDWSREDVPKEELRPERCWFSDGGITSNFPLHFFDSPIPRWPTFAINLRRFGRDWLEGGGESVRMATDNGDDDLAPWAPWTEKPGFGQIKGFAGAIFDTSRGWIDSLHARSPGYRDRIVHIAHTHAEGGLNLEMDPKVIKRLSQRGASAGERLIDRFFEPPGDGTGLTWANQRWVRYRAYMAAHELGMLSFMGGYIEQDPPHPDLAALNQRGPDEPPDFYRWDNRDQRELALELSARMLDLVVVRSRASESMRDGSPGPEPELRLSPRF